jgi:hypothetical protein
MAQSPMPEQARAAAAAAAAGCLGRKMYRVDIVNVMYGRRGWDENACLVISLMLDICAYRQKASRLPYQAIKSCRPPFLAELRVGT